MIRYPAGPVRTLAPWGVAFDIGWDQISQWAAQLAVACDEFAVPEARAAGHVTIESQGKRTARQVNQRYGDTFGLMQVNPRYHQALIERLAGRRFASTEAAGQALIDDPQLALRAGCGVLRGYCDEHGSWDQASSAFFLGNPRWEGEDSENGNTGPRYRAALNGLIDELEAVNMPDPLNWDPIPWPKMRDAIVQKPGEGAGFYRVAARGPRIVGSCNHITDGVPSGDQIEWYRRFFSTGGERQWDALTDVVIARNGEIGLLNDWRDPNRGGTRAGWANGTTDGLEGDGVAFFKWYPAINDVLVSKEHVTTSGRALTDAQIEASIALSAAVAQSVKCPWDTYPYHPGFHGVNIEQLHANFATKPCPDQPFIGTHYPVIKQGVKARLQKQQTGSTNPGNPTPPPEPDGGWPFGFGLDAMTYFFGTLTRYDGLELGFDPTGPLSLLWANRCRQEGKFPEAESWVQFNGRDVVQWEGGWTAIREGTDPRATWSWLDKGAPAPQAALVAA
jgi:hypothetical protein